MTNGAAATSVIDEPEVGCPGGHRHLVEFYETESWLAGTVARFLAPAFQEPGVAVVVATPAHRAAFEEALTETGIDVPEAAAAGRYISMDAAHLLATFLVDGVPDMAAFNREVGGLLERLAGDGRTLRIYGEMVALLWESGDAPAAVALEDLWNHIAWAYDFELLCAYRVGAFDNEDDALAFRRVCEQHSSRPEQVLLAELAYADALTKVINQRTSWSEGPSPRTAQQRGIDRLLLAAYRNAAQLMSSPGGRVLGDMVATEVAQAPVGLEGVLLD